MRAGAGKLQGSGLVRKPACICKEYLCHISVTKEILGAEVPELRL